MKDTNLMFYIASIHGSRSEVLLFIRADAMDEVGGMSAPVTKHCPKCGSNDIATTANVIWDSVEQKWIVEDVHGEAWCRECKAEFDEPDEKSII